MRQAGRRSPASATATAASPRRSGGRPPPWPMPIPAPSAASRPRTWRDIVLDGEPGGLTHAYFCSSGSEGTEASLKLARQYFVEIGQPQRAHFIARRQGYHGNTLGALAAGGNMMRRALYEPILSPAFSLVSPCFAYRFKRDERIRRAVRRSPRRRTGSRIPAARPRHRRRRAGGNRGRRHHRLRHRAAGLFPARARDLRPPRRAADPRRGDVRHGPHRHACTPGSRRGWRRTCRWWRRDWAAATSRSAAC